MSFWKKKQFWGSVVAIALMVFCLKDIEPSEVKRMFFQVNYFYLFLALVCSFVFIIIKGLRWRVIISQQKDIPPFRAVTLFSAGQIINIVMPVLTGQVGRLFLFSKYEGLRKTVIFSTIILEILFDAISLVVFLFLTSLAFAFPAEYRTLSIVILSITIVVLIAIYLILHFQTRLENLGKKYLRKRSPGVYISLKKFLRSFSKGMELLKSSQHIIGSMLYSVFSWGIHTLVIFFLLQAFGITLHFAAAAAIMIVNTLAVMIPITPGNAGTFELAVSSSLAAFSVAKSDAILFALALHLLDLLPIFVLGYIFLHLEKVSIRKIKTEHESEDLFAKVSEEGTYLEEEEKT